VQITSVLHIRTALAQAALAAAQGTLRTRTVHSEILWALSPTHNVGLLFELCAPDD
jgi:EKC/KEOPS complex subunit CGI121/TPRKB